MGDRDENGRLKLPDANYVPFQRVLSISRRGSKNSSRQESPEHTPRKNRSHRQWPSSESKRSIRSHSYNISEYRNTHDDDKNGYYFDGDHENDEDKHHRHKSRHRDPSSDMTNQLNDLSLKNGRRPRSKSLSNGSENKKMPYIPFQRVLNIRTRKPPVQPERAFRVPAFTGLRDRKDFKRSDGYTSEYKSRFNQRQKQSYVKKKPARGRNESSLNDLLNERDNFEQSDNEHVDNNHEPSENGDDNERSNHSRLSRVSKHSHGSSGHDEGTTSGHEDRSDSSSLVKFPQIEASPRMTIETAKSIEGKGAVPPSRKISMSFQSTDSASQSPLLVQETIQAIDTSRWVEGKGAGRLSHYFKVISPENKNEVNNNHETLKVNEHTEKNIEKGAEMNKVPDKQSKAHSRKNLSQKQQKILEKVPKIANSQIKRNHGTKTLPRSKSDSALLHGTKIENNNSQGPIQHLKSNEIIIFKENGTTKSNRKISRPRTSLPKIVLTMAEDQNPPDRKKILEKSITKKLQKGAYQATAILNLPNISLEKKDENYTSFTKISNTQPVSLQLQQKLNTEKFENSTKKKMLNLKKPLGVKKKLAIGTFHKSSNTKQNRKMNLVRKIKYKMNKDLQLQSYSTQNQNFLQVTKHHIRSAKLKHTKQEMNVTPKRFSKKNSIPQVNQYTLNEKLPITPDQGTLTEPTHDITQKHIENIRQQRSKRLQRFSHFLRPKNKVDEIII